QSHPEVTTTLERPSIGLLGNQLAILTWDLLPCLLLPYQTSSWTQCQKFNMSMALTALQ
uniref:Uncharacterized protein n=1 Tax=Felis catus TaxID=9685 RepID=A0ABI7XPY7_FELCA